MSHSSIADQFYSAFAALDGEKMVALYSDTVAFEDPAFGPLMGVHAKNMWRMLCASQKGKDFTLNYDILEQTEQQAKVNWEAIYNFSKTNRRVHNRIEATLRFEDGKIIRHQDIFDLYRWSRQALGPIGTILGWTPYLQSKIRKMANDRLGKFEAKMN